MSYDDGEDCPSRKTADEHFEKMLQRGSQPVGDTHMPVKELIHGQTVYPQGRKLEVSSKFKEWTEAAARALNTHDALLKAATEIRDWMAGGDVPEDLFRAFNKAINAADGSVAPPGPWQLGKDPDAGPGSNWSIPMPRSADELNCTVAEGAKILGRIGPKRAEELDRLRGSDSDSDQLRRAEDPEAVHLLMPSDPGRLTLARVFACGKTWPRELWGNLRSPQHTDDPGSVTCLSCLHPKHE